MNLRQRMILSMLSVVAVSGVVSTSIGGCLLWRQLNHEAENRVRQDLNAAREFYNQRLAAMETALRYTAIGERFSQAVEARDMAYVATRLDQVRRSAGLDVLCVTDAAGRAIYRAQRSDHSGDSLAEDRVIAKVLAGANVASGTLLFPKEILEEEGASLAETARIRILDTPKARPSDLSELDAGMMLCSGAPVFGSDGKLAGVLRSGVLVNRNYALVDQVQNTVFRDEQYEGKLLGNATIFQDDVRISTNVRQEDGSRAIGTRVSAEVYDYVLRQGKTWVGAAWVVNDRYVSAYEPIYDMDGKAIGMLYVGVLARKYSALALRTLVLFELVTLAGLVAAGIVAWKLASSISRPVSRLATASAAVAKGDFSQTLPINSSDEIGSLTQTFNTMAQSLKERDELLKEQTRLQLTRSERLAAVGRLAAGVAHEINNPLTGVLTFSHLLLKSVPENSQEREDVQTVIDATNRCKTIVRGLLDFSRQNEPNKKLSDLNGVLREAMNLTQNQALLNRVRIVQQLTTDLPHLVMDASQIEQVAVNVIVNAIDAMSDGGRLAIRTRALFEDGRKWLEFEIADTGGGIAAEHLDHIFDPFFTTKPTGKGTGLGLAIAYGIVTEHGGRINVTSEVNIGTTVTVRLPGTMEEERREVEGTSADR